MTAPALTCVDCGKPVRHDIEAECWLHREVLYDPDRVDYPNDGTCCDYSGTGFHRLAGAA